MWRNKLISIRAWLKRRRKATMIGATLVVGLAVVSWVIWQANANQATAGQTKCYLNTLQTYVAPPKVAHQYEGETLNYQLRGDGRYTASDSIKKFQVTGYEYELRVNFDQPFISPAVGSKLTGRIELLQDGQPISNLPKDSAGKSALTQMPQIAVGVYGVQANSGYGDFVGTPGSYWTDSDAQSVLITSNRLPYPTMQLISPQATAAPLMEHSNGQRFRRSGKIDLVHGSATFEFIYFGGRYSPYLEFIFADTQTSLETTRTICFGDQANGPIGTPKLTREVRGDFYYQINTSPAIVKSDNQQRVEVNITARQTNIGKVFTSPYQRVKVWGYQMIKSEISRHSSGAETPMVKNVLRGQFVGPTDNDKQVSELATKQLAEINSATFPVVQPSIEIDLIDGRGKVYFDYNGEDGTPPAPLVFVAQPVNYDLPRVSKANRTDSYRDQQPINLPDKPVPLMTSNPNASAQIIQTPAVAEEYTFLYGKWMLNDSLAEKVYTIVELPVSKTASTGRPSFWLWFLASQLVKLIASGGLIWLLFKLRK
ncbi:MAG: hypothetical protein V1826_02630 [bacterium]